MSIGQRLAAFVQQPAVPQIARFIEIEGGHPFEPDASYLRVFLADMYLAESRKWFRDRVPAATVSVAVDRAGAETLDFTTVAKPPERTGAGVFRNHGMMPLVPYLGGVVSVGGALVAVEGDSRLAIALDVLGGLSALVAPPLTVAVTVARGINEGLGKLLDSSGIVELAVHESFVAPNGSGNRLRPGYLAVVAVDRRQDVDPARLTVVDGQLYHGGSPLTGHDFLLFHIESREERDDWLFPELQAIEAEARRKLMLEDRDGFAALRQQALATIVTTSELTEPDRWRVVKVVEARLERARTAGAGAIGGRGDDLASALRRDVMPLEEARLLPPITIAAITS